MKRHLRRALSLLCVLAMCLSLLPTTALADDSREYEAVAFAQIDALDGNKSNNQHTVAYAIWTDADGDYYLAVSAQKDLAVTLPDGQGSADITKCDVLTVRSENETEIDNLAAEEVSGNAKDICWSIIKLTEAQAKAAFTSEGSYLEIGIHAGGHQLEKVSIPPDFVRESGIDKPEDPDDEDEDVNITPTAKPITIQVVVNGNPVTGGAVATYITVNPYQNQSDSGATDWDEGTFHDTGENAGTVTYSITYYDCKDIGFAANSGYVIEAIDADLVFGQSGCHGIYDISNNGDLSQYGEYMADNVQGGSTVTVYVRTVYTVEHYLNGDKLGTSPYNDSTLYVKDTTELDVLDGNAQNPENETNYHHVNCGCTEAQMDCDHTGWTNNLGGQPSSDYRVKFEQEDTITLPELPTAETDHTVSGWWLNDANCTDGATLYGPQTESNKTVAVSDAIKTTGFTGNVIKFYALQKENDKPSLEVTKTLDKVNGEEYLDGMVEVGDTLTYTIVVKNTGSTTLHGVEVTDTIKGAGTVYLYPDDKTGNVSITGATATITELKSNNEVKLTATYEVVANDAGQTITNTAVAKSDDVEDKPEQDPSVTVENPKLTVDKTASVDGVEIKSGESVNIGDEITYTITVRNDGNTTFEKVTVTDEMMEGTVQILVSGETAKTEQLPGRYTIEDLKPGSTVTLTYTYKATEDDVENGISNTVDVESGSTKDDDTIKIPVSDPGVSIGKTVSGMTDTNKAMEGDELTYTITVTNTGNTKLDVVVSDDMWMDGRVTSAELNGQPIAVSSGSYMINGLEVGESKSVTYTYTVTAQDVANGKIDNVATADINGGEVPEAEIEISTPTGDPSLTVEKTASADTVQVGDTITYTVEVKNDGYGVMNNVVIQDNKWIEDTTLTVTGDVNEEYTVGADGKYYIEKLEPGEFVIITYAYTPTESGALINKVTVTSDNLDVVPDDEVTVQVTPKPEPEPEPDPDSDIVVTKDTTWTTAKVGDTVTWTITVENTGDTPLYNVWVSDPMMPGDEKYVGNLGIGESWSTTYEYTVTWADEGDILENHVIVTAETDDGSTVRDEDSTETTIDDGELTGTVTIQPADITIYTGGEPYGGITDENGAFVVEDDDVEASGLPEPGYHLELSDDVIDWLRANGVAVSGGDDAATDLEDILSFEYRNENDEVIRRWTLEYVGIYDVNEETGEPTRYVYSLVTEIGDYDVRLQYLDGDEYRFNDDIDMDANTVFAQYEMSIYGGGLDESQIVAVLSAGGKTQECTTVRGTGTLTIRSTTDEEYVNDIGANADGILADGNVTYYVNDSGVTVDEDRVGLLVDQVSNSDSFNQEMAQDAMDHAIDSSATDWTHRSDLSYDMAYLDLVDTLNGHAVVTMGEGDSLTIYWPMPNDADRRGDFHVVHYHTMDRESIVGENDLDDADKEILTGEAVRIDGRWYVAFDADSFSPFVLVYEAEDDDDDRPRPPRPDDDDEDEPDVEEPDETPVDDGLNREDHYAYLAGYTDGTIRPEGNITRAEVATIFFRLMTDEYREDCWSQHSGFTDVSSASWYNNAVSTTAQAGWIAGYEDGSFRPNAYITRAEFATIAARFLSEGYAGGHRFNDIQGHWAADYINRAAAAGWIGGYEDGSFRPNAYITRAEVATLVNRMLDRAPDAGHLLPGMVRWPDNPETAWYYADIQEATNSHDYTWAGTGHFEVWTELLANRDWAALEEIWSQANDAPGGEVMD